MQALVRWLMTALLAAALTSAQLNSPWGAQQAPLEAGLLAPAGLLTAWMHQQGPSPVAHRCCWLALLSCGAALCGCAVLQWQETRMDDVSA